MNRKQRRVYIFVVVLLVASLWLWGMTAISASTFESKEKEWDAKKQECLEHKVKAEENLKRSDGSSSDSQSVVGYAARSVAHSLVFQNKNCGLYVR